jgi:hypothetical protein
VFLNASDLNKALTLQTYIARAPLGRGAEIRRKINLQRAGLGILSAFNRDVSNAGTLLHADRRRSMTLAEKIASRSVHSS